MASILASVENKDAVRVKVKKCSALLLPEHRQFSVDPQITSFEVLRSLLSRAFDLNGHFNVAYVARDFEGEETLVPLLSDWDLDAAFLAASEPHLELRVDCDPIPPPAGDDWQVVDSSDDQDEDDDVKRPGGIAGSILGQVERTLTLVQRAALSLVDGDKGPSSKAPPPAAPPPVADAEFRRLLDADGKVTRPEELRRCVFRKGLDPALRRVAWKHVLNVYPDGLSGRQRVEYVRRKCDEYYGLRASWQQQQQQEVVDERTRFVTNMVRKDVLRTDRAHAFYAGSDDNANVASLFNVLATYALHHPSVSYCQGMSDLASPLLVVMRDEAQAYVCFCALMKRLRPNFLLDGRAMSVKFAHLADALRGYDPDFFGYLRRRQADDLLFCYRWLLLEMKREFAFDDALRMLEVLWSSLPHRPPEGDLALFEVEFRASDVSDAASQRPPPSSLAKETAYANVRAIRRQSSGSRPSRCASSEERLRSSSSSSSSSCETSVFAEPCPSLTNSCEEAVEVTRPPLGHDDDDVGHRCLAPPHEFGGGNPFLMFLCLTLLLQHRDRIVSQRMDYNELAMHFDKMVRKHDVTRVLGQARAMFADYLARVANDRSSR